MSPHVRLASIQSSGGDTLKIPAIGVTCIVGGNNVGKSQLLRDIASLLQYKDAESAITVSSLTLDKENISVAEAKEYLERNGVRANRGAGVPVAYTSTSGGSQLQPETFVSNFNLHPDALMGTSPFFVWHASAGTLQSPAAGSHTPEGMEGSGAHPLMKLFRDGALERTISSLAHKTFGYRLTLDRINGPILIRVGEPDAEVPPLNNPTSEYAEAVRKLPHLADQGDGIKSFMGLALSVIAGTSQILLIDEPEAFLHPAQARALGRWIASEASERGLQILLATHDRDLVLGLLQGLDQADVHFARLSRTTTGTAIRSLTKQELSTLWSDPVLRYSNVMQGLFHSRVVIAESDADCRFYSAVLDQLGIDTDRQSATDDVLFVPSGGKDRVAAMADSLSNIGVETFAILDFDALNKRDRITGILAALGGVWTTQMAEDYLALTSAEPNQKEMWARLKNGGLRAVKKGPTTEAATRLVQDLAAQRLILVPVGEMEDFERTISNKASAWVTEMLSRNGHATCTEARDLVRKVIDPLDSNPHL